MVRNAFNLLKSELIRNTSVLVSGTILAQLIYLLLQPLVRRLFPVEAFGIYSVYMSLIGIVAVLSTLRYDDAIVLPSKDKDSANLLFLSLVTAAGFNIILFIIIYFFFEKIPSLLNIPTGFPGSILYLIPAGAFLLNAYQALNYWLIRKKKYTNVSINKLIRRSAEGGSQISFAFSGAKPGLIFSDIIGQVANVIASTIQAFRNGLSLKMVSIIKVRYVFKKYSEFPKYNLIPSFMSTYSFLMPPLIINKFFSAESAGLFDASKTLLSVPLALIASSLSNVLLQKTSERYNLKESIMSDLRSVLMLIIPICIAEIIIILLLGPWLFKVIFSPAYEISGVMSKILVWSFVLNFIIASFSALFYSLRKIRIYSIWQIFYFVAIISLFLFVKLEFIRFLEVYVMIEVISYLSLILIIIRMVRSYERRLIS